MKDLLILLKGDLGAPLAPLVGASVAEGSSEEEGHLGGMAAGGAILETREIERLLPYVESRGWTVTATGSEVFIHYWRK